MYKKKNDDSGIIKKKKYVKPAIKKVWDENIGMTGVYLLEM
ncbi:MAG: hypothetical protein ACFFDN_52290 [Candidatus Hodarchaeota archaeon]